MKKEIRGVHYHYELSGEGDPLLLLHGFTGSTEDWGEMADELDGFTILAVDLIGHGKTEAPPLKERYSMEETCRDLKELLDALEFGKVSICGYSMGGRAALSFAMLFPDRVSRLILESASPGLRTKQERDARIQSDENLAEKIQTEGILRFTDYWEKLPLLSQERLSPEKRAAIRKQRLGSNPVGLANSLRGMGTGIQPDWWEQLPNLSLPVLILTGQLDKKFCTIGAQMEKLFPDARLERINHAGHTIHVEQPEIFGTMISGFLKQSQ
ncbi:2-succinyl-6-hydroxy-2,4-cyclohexadiene-1-carboxylate synthase [Bacillus mangrovi]|uniref:Putative 2-succinyl-6-hydroxy-2,4-cyclohexadiene-1-carboxylate synthase n=1 Tax=Metabacillus mangrovi TaxID=1491830 RepID=A0A7X2V5P9_9BACI|nr:2-succinyl-6-hydroxy-2,4-cyclohexadiene-1-carboxylate synthase [Metabacillus mangrovi]MTH54406.1 2-succinyl-6-hydroxy-2,4-cyclohexadiene-1-carboxylate synthase [Metabacillus mangrovi]